jgi:hypothetical protein
MSYRALSECTGHMTLPAQGRSLGLYLLRLIAVVLVMGSHLRTVPDKARWLIGSLMGADFLLKLQRQLPHARVKQ